MAGIKRARLETLSLLAEILTILRLHIANVTYFNDTGVATRNLERLQCLTKRLGALTAAIEEMEDDD